VPFIWRLLLKKGKKAEETALKILLFIMYLLLALKAETVGSDISGYKEWYEYTGTLPFNNFSYCYMENGYLLLMKMGNIVGLSFQAFEAIIYAVALLPLYFFIRNNSSNVTISVLILFCLDFFVFACSGLRQTLAMCLCAGSFTLLTRSSVRSSSMSTSGVKVLLLSILIVIASSFVHRSALLFIPVLLIVFFQFRAFTFIIYVVVLLFLLLNQHYFIDLNQELELSKYEYDDRLTLGLMFVFDVIMFVFYLVSIQLNRSHFSNNYLTWQYGSVLFYGFLLMIAFNGSILMRSAIYELLFLTIIMPSAIQSWGRVSRDLISFIYIAIMFYCLYFLILQPNALRIVPYKFFFQ